MKGAAGAAALSALPRFAFSAPLQGEGRIKVAIVGCGRGGGIIAKSMMAADADISICAIADIFEDTLEPFAKNLSDHAAEKFSGNAEIFSVKREGMFSGWDAYKMAIASGVDAVAFATPPVFRPVEAAAAVAAGKHVFLDKPLCVDAVGARSLYEISKTVSEKKLTALCGTQRRWHRGYVEAVERVKGGQIGDILGAQCHWFFPHYDGGDLKREDLDPDEMEYQIRNWKAFIWTSGDHILEQQIHSFDVVNWIMGEEPKEVMAVGGRNLSLPFPKYGNRYSHFAADYDYGAKGRFQAVCRQEPKTAEYVLERVVGTKGVLETNLFGAQKIIGENPWQAQAAESDGRLEQFRDFFGSIRNARAVNGIKDLTDACLMAIAGRLAAYSGKKFKHQWVKARSKENLLPQELKFGKNCVSPVPVAGEFQLI